jgi:UDP-GlcNAc:undecaprenyl-phosphate/decaprenyl-phosphate GlcNAc-1-phosphate transferase
VILHARAAAEISDYDYCGSHVTVYLLLAFSSAGLALLLTPLVGRGSRLLGLVDAPGGRKVHAHSVPRLGGVAVVLAAGLAILLVQWLRPGSIEPPAWQAMGPFLLAGAMIFGAGLIDDVRGLGTVPKLLIEFAAAAVVMSSGLLIERISLLGFTWSLGWIAWPVTAAWLVGVTNAFNLIDGIDGLAAGITALAGAACCSILIVRGHAAEAMLLAAMVGASLGFLVFNFAPASIFLGDGGSLLAGFVLAATAITGWQKGATALATGVPLMIFALPIADSALALLRRSVARPTNGRSIRATLRQIAEPDRQHIHHRMLAMGWSVRRTVLVLYGITAILSLLALATADVKAP